MKYTAVMESCIFSIITPVISVMWSFRNHSNMIIWCLRNIYQCWEQLSCLIFLWKLCYNPYQRIFQYSLINRKFNEKHLKEENMDAVIAREKRTTCHANFANGAWGKYSFKF